MKNSGIMVGRYEIHSWDLRGRRQMKDLEAVKNIKKDTKRRGMLKVLKGRSK